MHGDRRLFATVTPAPLAAAVRTTCRYTYRKLAATLHELAEKIVLRDAFPKVLRVIKASKLPIPDGELERA